ncbi:N-terminal double-transmembrane domain-containing protein [Robiginitalea myxolifaciens]|uniref:N-terminal double-transmembrane domain-containing protein n=1 Tax=Robiginitalea myxolifaciens TaxID=400055 RepID=A0A1I6GV86_9FLAO|nr:BatA domain-containing protein [Robiginitalea myxolifaciens]SFR46164.1 N-terminal double-transmembrane domain-containing protein [Robiginitalea myxolifaciens]
MNFANPNVLWGLSLLLIPILVHLLRLRRFRKTEFTNVRMLQQLVLESNKSSTLKKWLLLFTRLGLLAALVLAFAQPFQSNPDATTPREILIYLDNSFSMQAPGQSGSLLETTVQELVQTLPGTTRVGLITNSNRYAVQQFEELKETLLSLDFSSETLDANGLSIRAASAFSETPGYAKEFWMLSDFEDFNFADLDTTDLGKISAVGLTESFPPNRSLDTAFIAAQRSDYLELQVEISDLGDVSNSALSLYNRDTLIAKSAPVMDDQGKGIAVFSLPANEAIEGSIRLTDNGLTYDNNLYFTLSSPPLIRVYGIGEGPWEYLTRLYPESEFQFSYDALAAVDYSRLPEQHLVILNEVKTFPEALIRELSEFHTGGGNVVIIPAVQPDVDSYNTLLRTLGGPRITGSNPGSIQITEIRQGHPLYRNVFEGAVESFDFPSTLASLQLERQGNIAIGYQNSASFLSTFGELALFTSALNPENSNFVQSPLIVPTFYNLAKQSLPFPDLYFTLGEPGELALDFSLPEDRIFRLESDSYGFIPRQENLARKTRLSFRDEPLQDGHYRLIAEDQNRGVLSFNYARKEGRKQPGDLEFPEYIQRYTALDSLLSEYQNSTRIKALWKWFVIFALLFALTELILQKTIR